MTVKVAVTGVTLNKTTLELIEGANEILRATVSPANVINRTVTWSSNDTAIATVDATGMVTAVKEGSATITVTTEDGAKTATCAVTVKAATPPSEGDVYAGGYVMNVSGKQVATIWKNGTAQSLSDGITNAYILSVYASGSDVYAGGYVVSVDNAHIPTIWKNGTAQSLADGSTYSYVSSIYVSGSDVHAGGFVNDSRYNVATLWKNGKAQSLSDGTGHASVNAICVYGSDVYAGGYLPGTENSVATVWKNGKAQLLSDGTTMAAITSIFVVE